MNTITKYGITSGGDLKAFLEDAGLPVVGTSGLDGSENIIRLHNLTTMNWKSRDEIVRINCKERVMDIIESKTNLTHIDNGRGDPTREYSFIVETFADLIDVVCALKVDLRLHE